MPTGAFIMPFWYCWAKTNKLTWSGVALENKAKWKGVIQDDKRRIKGFRAHR